VISALLVALFATYDAGTMTLWTCQKSLYP
jgi:hypothetical protein